jgi:hypothetical protein
LNERRERRVIKYSSYASGIISIGAKTHHLPQSKFIDRLLNCFLGEERIEFNFLNDKKQGIEKKERTFGTSDRAYKMLTSGAEFKHESNAKFFDRLTIDYFKKEGIEFSGFFENEANIVNKMEKEANVNGLEQSNSELKELEKAKELKKPEKRQMSLVVSENGQMLTVSKLDIKGIETNKPKISPQTINEQKLTVSSQALDISANKQAENEYINKKQAKVNGISREEANSTNERTPNAQSI